MASWCPSSHVVLVQLHRSWCGKCRLPVLQRTRRRRPALTPSPGLGGGRPRQRQLLGAQGLKRLGRRARGRGGSEKSVWCGHHALTDAATFHNPPRSTLSFRCSTQPPFVLKENTFKSNKTIINVKALYHRPDGAAVRLEFSQFSLPHVCGDTTEFGPQSAGGCLGAKRRNCSTRRYRRCVG
jgi:hypothetical protein